MFEQYQCAGVYIAIQAVLTLYAQGQCSNAWRGREGGRGCVLMAGVGLEW